MFRIGQRVQFSIRSTRSEDAPRVTLPGVVVDHPVEGIRPGTNIRESRVKVISLRESADGRQYLRLSDESDAFLAPRGAPYVIGLDVTDDGTVISVPELRRLQYADLQAYLTSSPTAILAAAMVSDPLPDAPTA